MPGLLEVLGSFLKIEVITVGIRDAWSFDWSIRAVCLGTPFVVVNYFLFVDVLTIIAVPKWVVAVLLPPLTVQIGQLGVGIWLWFWTVSFNWSKDNALLIHCTG